MSVGMAALLHTSKPCPMCIYGDSKKMIAYVVLLHYGCMD
jgi:hypothetical protein